jgi:hypothetical protein
MSGKSKDTYPKVTLARDLPGFQEGLVIPTITSLVQQFFLDLRVDNELLPDQFQKLTHWQIGSTTGTELFYWETENVYFHVVLKTKQTADVTKMTFDETTDFILKTIGLQRATGNSKPILPNGQRL